MTLFCRYKMANIKCPCPLNPILDNTSCRTRWVTAGSTNQHSTEQTANHRRHKMENGSKTGEENNHFLPIDYTCLGLVQTQIFFHCTPTLAVLQTWKFHLMLDSLESAWEEDVCRRSSWAHSTVFEILPWHHVDAPGCGAGPTFFSPLLPPWPLPHALSKAPQPPVTETLISPWTPPTSVLACSTRAAHSTHGCCFIVAVHHPRLIPRRSLPIKTHPNQK